MLVLRPLLAVAFGALAIHAATMAERGVVARDSYFGDFEMGELTWTGPIEEGGAAITFNGTAEQILDQIYDLNPDFVAPNDPTVSKTNMETLVGDCNPRSDWKPQRVSRLVHEAQYLYDLGTQACNTASKTCVRVACSYDTAVYMCNHREYGWGPTCEDVAAFVYSIIEACRWRDDSQGVHYARGTLEQPGSHTVWAGRSLDHC